MKSKFLKVKWKNRIHIQLGLGIRKIHSKNNDNQSRRLAATVLHSDEMRTLDLNMKPWSVKLFGRAVVVILHMRYFINFARASFYKIPGSALHDRRPF